MSESIPLISGGPARLSPTISNLDDCLRWGCPQTPWSWASRWVLERAALDGSQVVCDLGAGDNPIIRQTLAASARRGYLVDNHLLPDAASVAHPLERVEAGMESLPFEDESIDVALSVSVLEHLPAEARRGAMAEIQRVLKPGGRAVMTIGNLLRADIQARALLQTLDFFVSRNCAVYLPLDVPDMLTAAPLLTLAGNDGREFCPGFAGYDEEAILAAANLCRDPYADHPAVAAHEALRPIVVCELGLMLVKQASTLSSQLDKHDI